MEGLMTGRVHERGAKRCQHRGSEIDWLRVGMNSIRLRYGVGDREP